jgi:hypothetical protein
MPNKRGIKTEPVVDGVYNVEVTAWKYYVELINTEFLEYSGYIYRGQREQSWHLEPTLDREVRELDKTKEKDIQERLLSDFQMSTRGRIKQDRKKITPDEWWALGQHYGLPTPLLDWTWSPYVAAFFAFHEDTAKEEHVAVWALHEHSIKEKGNKAGELDAKSVEEISSLYVFNPEMDENIRLISQAGVFTRAPLLVPVEKWIQEQFKGCNKPVLSKILIPRKDREKALIALNRMRINYLTLFPDLEGSSRHCRLSLSIDAYGP